LKLVRSAFSGNRDQGSAAVTVITLDFSTSYRGITDEDILPTTVRDPFGWMGMGQPEASVTLNYSTGSTFIPARDGTEGLPLFLIMHSPGPNQFDLINLLNKSFLRFDIPVDGPPIWENYVKAVYNGDAEVDQYYDDTNAYYTALDNWTNYVMTHNFRATSAAYSDKGGTLGQFSATDALILEDFTTAPLFFAVNIIGSTRSDTFSGGELDDTLSGAAGKDKILGQGGDDNVLGGGGDDILDGQNGSDTLTGDGGDDTLAGEAGNDHSFGGTGDDLQYGGAGADSLLGGADDDLIHGGADGDTVYGGSGADLLYGDEGNDALFGALQNDTLNGGAGKDSLQGDAGDDALSGGDGNDFLTGGEGNDVLLGGVGKDKLTGSDGENTFIFRAIGASNADRITDFGHFSDHIVLDRAVFSGIHAVLDPQELRLGTAAQDGDDRIIYDPVSGKLYYDPDGTLNGASSAAQVLFAIVVNHALLTTEDFLMS
jgi:Ca2+-binding RTX toxin-like protein